MAPSIAAPTLDEIAAWAAIVPDDTPAGTAGWAGTCPVATYLVARYGPAHGFAVYKEYATYIDDYLQAHRMEHQPGVTMLVEEMDRVAPGTTITGRTLRSRIARVRERLAFAVAQVTGGAA